MWNTLFLSLSFLSLFFLQGCSQGGRSSRVPFSVQSPIVPAIGTDLVVTHTAHLNAENIVPETTNEFQGLALFSYQPETQELSYILQHSVSSISSASIHGPATKESNGPVLFSFDSIDGYTLRGSFTLNAVQETYLLKGLFYILITSESFPTGAIRGQILAQDSLFAFLEGAQEVPPLFSRSHGIALFNEHEGFLRFQLAHTIANTTDAHLFGPAEVGEIGDPIFSLFEGDGDEHGHEDEDEHGHEDEDEHGHEDEDEHSDESSESGLAPEEGEPRFISGENTFAESLEDALESGLFYVNIFSNYAPEGELRGQVLLSRPLPVGLNFEATHSATLSAEQEVPAVDNEHSGLALFSYDSITGILTYVIEHSVHETTAIQIHGPALPGENGDTLFVLFEGEHDEHEEEEGEEEEEHEHGEHEHHELEEEASPLRGSVLLSPEQATFLLNGFLYVNILNEEFPDGAIRGQITSESTHVALLEQTQLVPPVHTVHKPSGVATFIYESSTQTLNFQIEHSSPHLTQVQIRGAALPKENGTLIFALDIEEEEEGHEHEEIENPSISGSLVLTLAEETALFEGRLYLQLLTEDFPEGSLRGQIVVRD